ncbi:MAG TPA: LLM class F420-dependent oxidoreductase [Acidimicrobiales bacterium]|jgi:probable F420-dependent oxidoreductase
MLEYPLHSDLDGGAWLDPANITAFARAAEEAGVDGIALTDHPAPSRKWLEHGGHETLDPFVGLGFIAAVTSRIRLMTGLAVVPYRNPFLLAKSMTAVDVVSGGRATFVIGAGYLRSEFAALGVDFDERNALFDEAIEVWKGLWATDDFHYEGRHFTAVGVGLEPRPVQRPHPPLWLGGNARLVRQRVARWGQGWNPMIGGGALLARTARTRAIDTDAELAALIREIKAEMVEHGRDPETLDVAAGSPTPPPADASVEERLDALGRLAELGVTWTSFRFPHDSVAGAVDAVRRYGDEIIAKADR